jgi:hypothetical protein
MRNHRIAIWTLLLGLSVAGIALFEASRCSKPIYIRLKLLSYGYLNYDLGKNEVLVGTKQADCSDRTFDTFNRGRPVYSGGKLVGCIAKWGWFTPAGVNDGRKMLGSERRFIVILTWIETFAFALGLVSLTALICGLTTTKIRRLQGFIFMSLVFVFSSCALSIALGNYGISVFKRAQWVPFNPDYGRSLISAVAAFRVPSNGLLLFWNNWWWQLWSSLAVIFAGTVTLYRLNTKWLPLLGTVVLLSIVFAGCGLWIWQSSMMNFYARWMC